eukprot:403351-Pelagomonas_calceolata.AAC.2
MYKCSPSIQDALAPNWDGIYYAILVYDVSSQESFESCKEWLEELKKASTPLLYRDSQSNRSPAQFLLLMLLADILMNLELNNLGLKVEPKLGLYLRHSGPHVKVSRLCLRAETFVLYLQALREENIGISKCFCIMLLHVPYVICEKLSREKGGQKFDEWTT